MFYPENLAAKVARIAMPFAALFMAFSSSQAQVCPILIEDARQQVVKSEMGTLGTAITVSYRNASPFAIRSVQFGIQALNPNNRVSKPRVIIASQMLEPNATNTGL